MELGSSERAGFHTGMKDEQTQKPMEDHTESCQHTLDHRVPQLWPFILVCCTVMLTVNPTRSNILHFLGYSKLNIDFSMIKTRVCCLLHGCEICGVLFCVSFAAGSICADRKCCDRASESGWCVFAFFTWDLITI